MGSARWLVYCCGLGAVLLCHFGVWGLEFCKEVSKDGRSCPGGCKEGSATRNKSDICAEDILYPALKRCRDPDDLKDLTRTNYGLHFEVNSTCRECKGSWDGPQCTREKIAPRNRKRDLTLQDGDLKSCKLVLNKTKLFIARRRSSGNLVEVHLSAGQSETKFDKCKIRDCKKINSTSRGVVRFKCNMPKSRPKQVWINCEEAVDLCEVNVYSCAKFWYGPENGCSMHCHCQDGELCDSWTGRCPPGKEIVPTTPSTVATTTSDSHSPSLTTTTIAPATPVVPSSSSVSVTTRPSPVSVSTTEPRSAVSSSVEPDLTATDSVTERTSDRSTPVVKMVTTDTAFTDPVVSHSYTDRQVSSSSRPFSSSSVLPEFSQTTSAVGSTLDPRHESTDGAEQPSTSDAISVSVTSATSEGESVSSTVSAATQTHTDRVSLSPDITSALPSTTTTSEEMTYTMSVAQTSLESRRVTDLQMTNSDASNRNADNDQGSSSLVGVLVGVVAAVVVVVLAFVAVVMYRKTLREMEKAGENADNICVIDMDRIDNARPLLSSEEEENQYMNATETFSPTTEAICVDAFQSHLRHMESVCGYSAEYQKLPLGLKAPVTAAEKANVGDVKKNRFKDISPYDDSRVVLKRKNDSGSDYINANYIDGFAEAMAYIAAQGPLPDTLEDFWCMIWSEGCSKIVMLTNLCEGNKVKCERYWPENEGDSQTFGSYTIVTGKVTQKAHFVHRVLSVTKLADQSQRGDVCREVHQFHFTAWPDHGVPCPVALLQFWSYVTLQPAQLGGPQLVHCSAGIGRTGTYIALDMLTHQADTTGKVSIFPTVRRMRKQRVNMVQTVSQYKFLHEVVGEWLLCRDCDIVKNDLLHGTRWKKDERGPNAQLPAAIKQMCATQFKTLDDMRPSVGSEYMTAALKKENAEKNRFPDILPVEEFRVCLSTADGGDSDYINAVFLPCLSRQQGYIVTQLPLQNTVSDFWQMVHDWRVRVIVRFMDAPADQDVELCPCSGQKSQHGKLSVLTKGKAVISPGVSRYNLQLQQQRMQSSNSGGRQVNMYCVESRKALSLKGTKTFVSLVNILLPYIKSGGQPPVVIQCFDGAGLSCVLCGLMMAVESMQMEERASPFLLARLIHTARPQAFRTLDQYEFMVQCLLHHAQGKMKDSTSDSEEDSAVAESADSIYGNV